ncbi:MAG: NnrS family protein, partial [Alphaproteobacteria bacterium]
MNAAARPGGPVVFAYGFRTFFLLAGIFAAVAMPVWVAMRRGVAATPDWWPAGIWHGHEMLFGYVMAVIAGFLLTASPNWTGAGPIRGARLAGLALVWLAGRVAMALSDTLPPVLVVVADIAFLPVLALSILPSLIAARKPQNLIFVPVLFCLAATNLVVHGQMMGWWDDGASAALVVTLDIVVLLIAAIGGRIVPSFTQAALQRTGQELEIAPKPRLDALALAALLVLAIVDAAAPGSLAAGVVALVAAIAHGARLARWKTRYTGGQSILWVLHLGYAALVAGLLLKGLAVFELVPVDAALHA